VETDRLIDSLAADLAPVSPRAVQGRIALVALVGGAAALAGVLAWLGLRADLATAVQGGAFWMKAGYAAALGVAGFLCAERLARPAASPRGGAVLGALAVALLVGLGLFQLLTAPSDTRLELWLGQSWRRCPFNILILSAPTLALAMVAIRRFAPTRLAVAGAAAGLFAGGVAALAYGLHCGETAPAFVATWYSLGIALSTALGAAVGPLALRWR
jgi:hypothetical protein